MLAAGTVTAPALLEIYLDRIGRLDPQLRIYNDVRALLHQDRLEKRTRNMAGIGSLLSDRPMAAVRAGESALAARIQSIFDDVDVVITPGNATGPASAPTNAAARSRACCWCRRRVPFFRDLESHRTAGRRGAVGACATAFRCRFSWSPVRRGDVAGAECADRVGEAVGAPATAGVMTVRSPARRPASGPAASHAPGWWTATADS
jgi:hypothetical protein